MEGAGLDLLADSRTVESTAQFARSLAGEREHEGVAGQRRSRLDPVRDPSGEHPRLARSGTGDHRDEPRLDGDRSPLVGVEVVEQGVGAHLVMVRPAAFRLAPMCERTRPKSTVPLTLRGSAGPAPGSVRRRSKSTGQITLRIMGCGSGLFGRGAEANTRSAVTALR